MTKKLSSYMPVYNENNRCDGWFCMGEGGSGGGQNLRSQRRPVAGAPGASVVPSVGNSYGVPSSRSNMPYMQPPVRSAVAPSASSVYRPMPAVGAMPHYGGQQIAPSLRAPVAANNSNIARPEGFPQWAVVPEGLVATGKVASVPTAPSSSEQGGDLHAWEAQPEWEKELPASPLDALQGSIQW